MSDDTIIDNGMGLTLQGELNQTLVQFSKELAIVQGEYNAGTQKLSVTQAHAEQAQERALKAILATVSKHLPEKITGCINSIKVFDSEIVSGVNNGYPMIDKASVLKLLQNAENTAITEMEKTLGGNDVRE